MSISFYNHEGKPIAYTDDEEHIFLFSGEAVAYLDSGSVYSYSGTHLGRFEQGWIRDNNGECVFFTKNAIGGPMKPMTGMNPIKGIKQIRPMKGKKKMKPMRPKNSSSWSHLSGSIFFDQ